MHKFYDLEIKYKNDIVVKFLVTINNKTLHKSYFYITNLNFDYGLCKDDLFYMKVNKKTYNKRISYYKSLTGKRIVLDGTDNDDNYTRLLYSLK